ncbi:hypothetical protein HMPREF3038_03307 [Akkermansia sp. KLE1797]|nr:hypothetical protein HMPREF3038_03307 [Akkermansia sp. KLE1797]
MEERMEKNALYIFLPNSLSNEWFRENVLFPSGWRISYPLRFVCL